MSAPAQPSGLAGRGSSARLSAPNVAIAGVTGAVGQEFLTLLAERDFPIGELKMLASARSAGKTIEYLPTVLLRFGAPCLGTSLA